MKKGTVAALLFIFLVGGFFLFSGHGFGNMMGGFGGYNMMGFSGGGYGSCGGYGSGGSEFQPAPRWDNGGSQGNNGQQNF